MRKQRSRNKCKMVCKFLKCVCVPDDYQWLKFLPVHLHYTLCYRHMEGMTDKGVKSPL